MLKSMAVRMGGIFERHTAAVGEFKLYKWAPETKHILFEYLWKCKCR